MSEKFEQCIWEVLRETASGLTWGKVTVSNDCQIRVKATGKFHANEAILYREYVEINLETLQMEAECGTYASDINFKLISAITNKRFDWFDKDGLAELYIIRWGLGEEFCDEYMEGLQWTSKS